MPGEDIKTFDAAVARAIPLVTEEMGTFNFSYIRTDEAWQGSFSGVDEKAYAVLESITFDLYKLVFDDLAAPEGTLLQVIGGGSHSELWLQLIADVLKCPVSVGSGDSLLGAAAMAAGKDIVVVKKKVFHPCSARRDLLDTRRNMF
jgi:sugar (pentulose or hexulose) kinase